MMDSFKKKVTDSFEYANDAQYILGYVCKKKLAIEVLSLASKCKIAYRIKLHGKLKGKPVLLQRNEYGEVPYMYHDFSNEDDLKIKFGKMISYYEEKK